MYTDVAILYVARDSIYKSLCTEWYDETRNALTYRGAYPVVAHPPCRLWGKFAKINYRRWGGERNRPGNDGGCFAFALATVNRCGGVLEHPGSSYAWAAHGLVRPEREGWRRSGEGWVCEVYQAAYGHRAAKRTWLYYVGSRPPFSLRWGRVGGSHQVGFHDQRGKGKNKPTLNSKEASATPLDFAQALIELARWSMVGSSA